MMWGKYSLQKAYLGQRMPTRGFCSMIRSAAECHVYVGYFE